MVMLCLQFGLGNLSDLLEKLSGLIKSFVKFFFNSTLIGSTLLRIILHFVSFK